jgi:hypothetical protein
VTVASTDAWAVCECDLRVREFDALPPFARALVDTLLAHCAPPPASASGKCK